MKKVLIVLTVLLVTVGCSNTKKKEVAPTKTKDKVVKEKVVEEKTEEKKEVKPTPGYLDGNTYINKFLGFSIDIPEKWSIQGEEQMKALTKAGGEMLAGDDENTKKALEAADKVNGLFKLAAFRYPLGTPGKLNHNIMVVGENMTNYPGIKDGKDYAENIKMFLNNSQMDMEITNIEPIELDGKKFYGIQTKMNMNGIKVSQKYYATIIKGYALGITLTYFNEESHKELQEILKTVKLEK